jgi:endonuclease YncB( thermonuclease family)
MFLNVGLLSRTPVNVGLLLAAVTFVLGLGIGSTVGPVTAGRSSEVQSPPLSQPPRSEFSPVRLGQPAEVLRVIDGDTFEARINLWPGLEVTTRVRLRGIDAPELKARCDDERIKAEAARDALRAMLDQGEVGITRVTLDKYGGRVVADAFTAATPNVSAALLDAGYARRYAGGHRDGWCP